MLSPGIFHHPLVCCWCPYWEVQAFLVILDLVHLPSYLGSMQLCSILLQLFSVVWTLILLSTIKNENLKENLKGKIFHISKIWLFEIFQVTNRDLSLRTKICLETVALIYICRSVVTFALQVCSWWRRQNGFLWQDLSFAHLFLVSSVLPLHQQRMNASILSQDQICLTSALGSPLCSWESAGWWELRRQVV